MKPIIINADYMISPEEIPDVSSSTEIHFTRFGKNQFPNGEPSFTDENSYKIFCHVNEPTTSRWVEPIENIIKYHKKYDKIVTSNPEVLDKCSNAKFMVYGTTWLNKSKHHPDSFGKFTDDLGTLKKELSLSMVCGSLSGKPGYNLRHAIFQNQDKILVSKKFYSSTRFIIPNVPTLPNDNKIHLFNSMYSVAIESTEEVNYFSEKLIDCLITKTIPVYWGCPNISDFFDISYWLNVDDLINFNFTDEYYYNNLEKINNNFEKAKQYCDNIIERILKI
jgi:hypothetical protein